MTMTLGMSFHKNIDFEFEVPKTTYAYLRVMQPSSGHCDKSNRSKGGSQVTLLMIRDGTI